MLKLGLNACGDKFREEGSPHPLFLKGSLKD